MIGITWILAFQEIGKQAWTSGLQKFQEVLGISVAIVASHSLSILPLTLDPLSCHCVCCITLPALTSSQLSGYFIIYGWGVYDSDEFSLSYFYLFIGSCAPNSLYTAPTSLCTSSSPHLPDHHLKTLFLATIKNLTVPQHNPLQRPSITTVGFALVDWALPLSSFWLLVADPVLSKVLVSLFLGLAGNPQSPTPEVHLNILSLATLILSISLPNNNTNSEPGPTAATPPHAHLQVLFVNATSPLTLTMNNTTPLPSCYVHTLKLLSMDKHDISSLLPGLLSTLAALHQQHLTAITTHTQQTTTSYHHTAIHTQQTLSHSYITMYAQSAPSHCCITIHIWWAPSCCHITTHTLASPLHSLPHGYLYMWWVMHLDLIHLWQHLAAASNKGNFFYPIFSPFVINLSTQDYALFCSYSVITLVPNDPCYITFEYFVARAM